MWAFWTLIVLTVVGRLILLVCGLIGSKRTEKAYDVNDVLVSCIMLVLVWIAVAQVRAVLP